MEATDLAEDAVTILASYLPAIGDDDLRARCGPRLRALYDLVGERIAEDGAAGVFTEFVRDPQRRHRVRRLLIAAITADAVFAGRLAAQVAALRGTTRPAPQSAGRRAGAMAGRAGLGCGARRGGGRGNSRMLAQTVARLGGVIFRFRARF